MLNFCTYFDVKYIHRGLALYYSLLQSREPFKLWVLCFDDITYRILQKLSLPGIELIPLIEFEKDDSLLLKAKATRTPVEYYWTCTPSLPLYILKNNPQIDVITYLDADIFFFSSPVAILKELGSFSVLIVPHDYSQGYKRHEAAGIYNVGVMCFRNDGNGLSCLNWWRERCLEWCYQRFEDGKIGDQAYLNDWPELFQRVVVCKNPGVSAGPWNIEKYGIKMNIKGILVASGVPLVCFHFHACQICNSFLAFIIGSTVNLPTKTLAIVYKPYLEALKRIEAMLLSQGEKIAIPAAGIPWRYLLSRFGRGHFPRHFIVLNQPKLEPK